MIDLGYRGEIVVVLRNVKPESGMGSRAATVCAGERTTQLLITRVETPEVRLVCDLDTTERGEGGFGSTGM